MPASEFDEFYIFFWRLAISSIGRHVAWAICSSRKFIFIKFMAISEVEAHASHIPAQMVPGIVAINPMIQVIIGTSDWPLPISFKNSLDF